MNHSARREAERAKAYPEWLPGLAVTLAAAVGCYGLFIRQGMALGVIAYNVAPSARVLAGEIPYRDFLYNYTPGVLWLNAGLMRLFGANLMTVHQGIFLFKVASAVALFFAARLLVEGWTQLAAVGLTLAWLGSGHIFSLFPTQYSMLFLSIGLICFLLHDRSGRRRWLFLCGFSVGAILLFKHNVGLYVLTASWLALALRESSREATWRRKVSSMAAGMAWVWLGTLTVLAPAALFLASEAALRPMLSHFSRHAREYVQEGAVPLSMLGHGPLAFFGLVLAWVLAKRWRLTTRVDQWWAEEGKRIIVFLFALAAFLEVFPRADETHLVRALPPTFLLLSLCVADLAAFLQERPGRTGKGLKWVSAALPLSILLPCGLMGLAQVWLPQFGPGMQLRADTPVKVERGAGILFEAESARTIDEMDALIGRHTGLDDPVLSFANRGGAFCFLSNRRNPSRLVWWSSSGISERERAATMKLVSERVPKLVLVAAVPPDPVRNALNSGYRFIGEVSGTELYLRIEP